ncbi:LacI family DNA-binding transcriptional regulator [Psychromicrobium xiongbiense]|uniref:LacI family DNA-binding transcriptional regulator n=1 Tax=Psychromicrobium xiongbiense TaxID=3051184 RepID=UPI0025540BDB|nr:LacI family DNA-binding transcriptional regulator [Psychromicrobium sp. YIM S02556]
MRVSLSDVARAAGVALSTASRAMTGNSEVGAATRARILETAAEMGYRPSLAGQALRAGRTSLIELAVPGPLPEGLVASIFESCESHGYHLLLTRPSSLSADLAPPPAVDGRIVLGTRNPAESDERAETLDVGGLSPEELTEAAQRAVDRLVARLGNLHS